MWELDCEESLTPKNWCFWTVVLEKTLESPLDCKEIQPVHPKGNQSWVFIGRADVEAETLKYFEAENTLATRCKELTHWKRPWCWGRLMAGGEGDDRWDGWMATPTQWTWVWVDSGSWWWTGRPGMLRFMESQRVRHNWAAELNWSKYQSLSWVQLFETPWTTAYQAPLSMRFSMRFSRQGYWSESPFPSPGDLPNPGIEPRSPELQADSLPTELQGKPSDRA